MSSSLELLSGREGERVTLHSPEVGTFTRALPENTLVGPGAPAGVLHSLGRAWHLVVPAGVSGRVLDPAPERVHQPVGYGTVLYRLAPLQAHADDENASSDERHDSRLAVRAPYSGRFWLRPAPGEPPFVQVGQELSAGSALGLIEVMKTFTHLGYQPGAGLPERARVVAVLVSDGAEITDRDELVVVEPA
jgi:acetyl-CoA carboxylase biotin carboxyl carrier protein